MTRHPINDMTDDDLVKDAVAVLMELYRRDKELLRGVAYLINEESEAAAATVNWQFDNGY